MEVLLAFVGGLALAAIVAFLVAKSLVGNKVTAAEKTARIQAESAVTAEKARMEADLENSRKRVDELQESLQQAKNEAASALQKAKDEAAAELQQSKAEAAETLKQTKAEAAESLLKTKNEAASALQKAKDEADRQLEQAKTDWQKRYDRDLEVRENVHQEAMKALQTRFDETMAKVSAQVKIDTGEMLKARQQEFSEASHQSIGQLVNPLKDNIAELKKAMEEGNKQQAERNGEMRERIQNLMEHSDAARRSADELAAAFKHGSKVQGDWGETILEELLASQGLTRGIHFDTQAVIRDAEGRPVRNDEGGIMRPDVILHLDERREVIIDSKVSLTAYVDYVNAENEADRQTCLKAHVDSLWKHVKELAAKDYSGHVQPPRVSAGYVIMFVPNVGALWTALNAEPDLWRRAADMNVYIADEQSLYGALKIVSLTWTQVAQAQNHERVYALAAEMIDRVGQFMEHYRALGSALKKVNDAYTKGDRKLVPQGQSILNTSRKLLKLGAKDSDKHPLKALLDVDEIPALDEGRGFGLDSEDVAGPDSDDVAGLGSGDGSAFGDGDVAGPDSNDVTGLGSVDGSELD